VSEEGGTVTKNWWVTVGIVLILLLIVIALFALFFAAVALIGLGLGYIVNWFTPSFSYFEATLLATIFAFITFAILRILARLFLPAELLPREARGAWNGDGEEEERTGEYKSIPQARFYQSATERTWAAWLTAEVANDVYAELQGAPHAAANLNQPQSQELAIRLAEAGMNIIKRKTGRARRLSINLNDLRRELNRMGQRPYEDDILRLALSAINMNLNFFEEPIRAVIRAQGWEQLTTMPESEDAKM